jgi:hypothetical protein
MRVTKPLRIPQDRAFEAARYIVDRMSIDLRTGCWLWAGPLDVKGYGAANFRWRAIGAHRLAYAAFIGPIAPGLLCCHTCDNPRCCNPTHIFLGTDQDNVDDMIRKGRQKPRQGIGCRLTDDEVRAIRQDTRKASEIADEYGISTYWAGQVRKGLARREVPFESRCMEEAA